MLCIYAVPDKADEGGYTGSFEQFFEDWTSNKIIFGSWLRHLREFVTAAQEPSNRILLVRYEELQTDLAGAVRRVGRFLECPVEDGDIARILPKVCIDVIV